MAAIKKLCKPYGLHSFCFTRYKIAYYGEKIKLNPGQLKPEFMQDLMSKNLFPPDDYFLKSIAESQGLRYTIGKQGYARFLSDSGRTLYPRNNGFSGTPITETLKKGSLIVDRYGGSRGSFVSPVGTPFAERALPKEAQNKSVHVYRINKDLPDVLSGRTAAWFEQPGGGWQYKLPGRVMDLTEYLEEV
ncbi:TNT domain-containing protein [Phascolarctobacterium sp.]|uniref:TNT domain-containing protein n=1 Tax=Phascolarctobacterium sp. TaxID=2049039 RepID=UPI0025FED0EF|nr:TNT domain-containing protein [uncultured Phascolarctobacterium sp.]